ncbi:hypothetical protein BT96DRAFT_937767 [Gymnopus androsaceus JB14]|uniref:Uncharacterized protein n=1 Tax=Gymnopus androsaceus JB14 TaxID=1447944 RepID=A0A6A4HYS5_9AGAR|nr:hypothetical protein BT96DRAFT_937767 [Gymnopus androsaceus JB14]
MCHWNHFVILTMDNFSGHYVEYEPGNVEVVYFKPNLTSHCQPCDSSIICCVKAWYWTKLAIHALDLDEAGESDIFKIGKMQTQQRLTNLHRQIWVFVRLLSMCRKGGVVKMMVGTVRGWSSSLNIAKLLKQQNFSSKCVLIAAIWSGPWTLENFYTSFEGSLGGKWSQKKKQTGIDDFFKAT